MARRPTLLRKAFGKALTKFRKEKGLSQVRLAEMVACTSVTISSLERGVSNPSLELIVALERALALRPGLLVAASTVLLRHMSPNDWAAATSAGYKELVIPAVD